MANVNIELDTNVILSMAYQISIGLMKNIIEVVEYHDLTKEEIIKCLHKNLERVESEMAVCEAKSIIK